MMQSHAGVLTFDGPEFTLPRRLEVVSADAVHATEYDQKAVINRIIHNRVLVLCEGSWTIMEDPDAVLAVHTNALYLPGLRVFGKREALSEELGKIFTLESVRGLLDESAYSFEDLETAIFKKHLLLDKLRSDLYCSLEEKAHARCFEDMLREANRVPHDPAPTSLRPRTSPEISDVDKVVLAVKHYLEGDRNPTRKAPPSRQEVKQYSGRFFGFDDDRTSQAVTQAVERGLLCWTRGPSSRLILC